MLKNPKPTNNKKSPPPKKPPKPKNQQNPPNLSFMDGSIRIPLKNLLIASGNASPLVFVRTYNRKFVLLCLIVFWLAGSFCLGLSVFMVFSSLILLRFRIRTQSLH